MRRCCSTTLCIIHSIDCIEADDGAGPICFVTREPSYDSCEHRATQCLNQPRDGRVLDSFGADREEIPFSHQREKCELMLRGRSPQAESGIGAPRRHRCRYGAVRKLFIAVTDDGGRNDPFARDQLIDFDPRA